MDEKLVAGFVTAGAVSPICAVCIVGPAAIGSLFAGLFGWLGGFEPLATVALMIAAAALVHRDFRRRRTRALGPQGKASTSGAGAVRPRLHIDSVHVRNRQMK